MKEKLVELKEKETLSQDWREEEMEWRKQYKWDWLVKGISLWDQLSKLYKPNTMFGPIFSKAGPTNRLV